MAQQWPSFPSEQARRLQQSVCASNFSVAIFTSNPCGQPGTVERCLQHTVGQRNQPSFSWDRQRNQPSFSWDQKWSPLFWKGKVLDMSGTYRQSSALRRLAVPGSSFWKGNILWIKACSPSGLSCSPTLFNRLAGTTEYVLYNNGVEDPQRYGWATDRGIL